MPELPWSLHRRRGWRTHWAQVKRWHARLMRAPNRADAEDFAYAFFQACYVLRDWLPRKDFPLLEVEAFIEKHAEMRLCRDLANMTKHGRLTRSSTGREPSFAREYRSSGTGSFDSDSDLVLLSQWEKHDPREIATRCLTLWEQFFASRDIVP